METLKKIVQTTTPDILLILSWLAAPGTPDDLIYAEFRRSQYARNLRRVFGEDVPWKDVRMEPAPNHRGYRRSTEELLRKYGTIDDLLVIGLGARAERHLEEAWGGTLILSRIESGGIPSKNLLDTLANEVRTIRLRPKDDPRRRIRIVKMDTWTATITPLRPTR